MVQIKIPKSLKNLLIKILNDNIFRTYIKEINNDCPVQFDVSTLPNPRPAQIPGPHRSRRKADIQEREVLYRAT